MGEYVMWGGPIVTRAVAYADCKDQGFTAKEIDTLVFGRASVAAPENPEAHVAFLNDIRALELAVRPTVKADYQTRVIAFATREEADAEAIAWKADGGRTRIIVRKGVANLLIAA